MPLIFNEKLSLDGSIKRYQMIFQNNLELFFGEKEVQEKIETKGVNKQNTLHIEYNQYQEFLDYFID